MRLIDKLPTDWGRQASSGATENSVLNLLNACLTFTYSDIPKPELLREYEHFGIPEQESSQRWFQILSREMSENFYDNLYVKRLKCSNVIDRFGQSEILVVCGYAGTGKSTVLRHLHQQNTSGCMESYLYINTAKHKDLFSSESTCQTDLALLIELRLNSLPGYQHFVVNLRNEFRAHRVRHGISEKYQNLRHHLDEYQPNTPQDFLDLLSDTTLREREEDAWTAHSPIDKLYSLLQYLKDCGHSTYLILDNLDRLPTRIQHILYDFCQTMQFGSPPLVYNTIALRTDNYHRLPNASDRSALEIPHDIDLTVTLEVSGEIDKAQENAYTEVDNIIAKRIEYCHRFLNGEDIFEYLKVNSPDLTASELQSFYTRYRQDIKALLTLIKNKSLSINLLPSYIQWHNSSVRSVCYHFYVLALHLLRLKTVKEKSVGHSLSMKSYVETVSDRNLRTQFLRSVIFDNRHSHQMNVINVFTEGQTVSPARIAFLSLKILQYIAKKIEPTQGFGIERTSSIPIRDVISTFDQYSVTASEVLESLMMLSRPRDFDPYGLIYIDGIADGGRFDLSDAEHRNVFLMPSGYFFWNSVSVTCEYIFWCACFTSVDKRVFKGGNTRYFTEQLSDDRFRLIVSLMYCVRVLLPRFKEELDALEKLGENPQHESHIGIRRKFLKNFGIERNDDLYLSRVQRGLHNFWVHSAGKDAEKDAVIKDLFGEFRESLTKEIFPYFEKWRLL